MDIDIRYDSDYLDLDMVSNIEYLRLDTDRKYLHH
jgi:hypothetical protein